MSEKRNLPDLRYPEFSGPWFQKSLGHLLEFKNGFNASKESYGSGEKFINVLDIIQNDFITHDKILGSVQITKTEFEKYKVEYGDILFQRSSETREEVGQANVYLDKHRSATFGGFVIRGKKTGEYNPFFLNCLLKTPQARNEITSKSGGSTRYNVGQETLSQVTIILPSLPEQQKIAEFLTAVDKRIEMLQAKKEKLEAYKKGVMQQIFSQKLRFKADDSSGFPDWEEKKLGKIIEVLSDYTANGSFASLKENVQYFSQENFAALVRTTDLEKSTFQPERFTDKKGYEFLKKTKLFGGEIILANVGSIGKVFRVPNHPKPMTLAPNTYLLKFTKGVDENFLYQVMLTRDFSNKLLSQVGSSTLKAINKSNLRSIPITLPSLSEQTKIVKFLTSLDSSIETLEKQINQTQTWKKGLLQKMFV